MTVIIIFIICVVNRKSPRHKRPSGLSKRSNLATGRKVGGGGIIGKKHHGRRHDRNDGGWVSEPETDPPCLTIIDFNMFIRKGLNGGGGKDGAWKGYYKKTQSAKIGTSRNNRFNGQPATSSTNNINNAGSGGDTKDDDNSKNHLLIKPTLKSKIKSNGLTDEQAPPQRRHGRKHSRNHYVRRRKAVLLRGTVTDCSPWEDSAEDGERDEGASSDASATSNHSEPIQKVTTFNIKHLIEKGRVRNSSPITPILLTI